MVPYFGMYIVTHVVIPDGRTRSDKVGNLIRDSVRLSVRIESNTIKNIDIDIASVHLYISSKAYSTLYSSRVLDPVGRTDGMGLIYQAMCNLVSSLRHPVFGSRASPTVPACLGLTLATGNR